MTATEPQTHPGNPNNISWEELVPKIKTAEEAFRSTQLEAWVYIEPDICGLEVLPFTPQMFVELDLCQNALLVGAKEVSSGDVAQFLWRVSRWHSAGNTKLRNQFFAHVAAIDAQQAIKEIDAYLVRAHAATPLTSKAKSGSVAAWPAYYVQVFGQEYGWDPSTVLNSPFRILHQLMNRVLERQDPDFKQRCPEALALKQAWLEQQNATQTPTA